MAITLIQLIMFNRRLFGPRDWGGMLGKSNGTEDQTWKPRGNRTKLQNRNWRRLRWKRPIDPVVERFHLGLIVVPHRSQNQLDRFVIKA